MKMQEIKGIAKEYGIKHSKLKKVDLVQTIQLAEGNFNCFATAIDGVCDQNGCVWREDCFSLAKQKRN